jgi:hypothetical protein
MNPEKVWFPKFPKKTRSDTAILIPEPSTIELSNHRGTGTEAMLTMTMLVSNPSPLPPRWVSAAKAKKVKEMTYLQPTLIFKYLLQDAVSTVTINDAILGPTPSSLSSESPESQLPLPQTRPFMYGRLLLLNF